MQTVVAELRAISNVLVLDAKVVANPLFYFPAPSTGKLIKLNDGKLAFKTTTDTTAQPLVLPENSKAISMLVPPETTVTKGLPIVSAVFSGFALQAQIPEEKIYRLNSGIISAKGEITNGPGPFAATILGMPFSPTNSYIEPLKASPKESTSTTTETVSGVSSQAGDVSNQPEPLTAPAISNESQEVIVVASIPSDLKLVVGMPGLLALKIAEETSAIALPLEAVAGVSQKGQVYVVKKGKRILRDVSLGISDGSYIQITSGLKVGEKVALPSPSLKFLK